MSRKCASTSVLICCRALPLLNRDRHLHLYLYIILSIAGTISAVCLAVGLEFQKTVVFCHHYPMRESDAVHVVHTKGGCVVRSCESECEVS